MDPHGLEDILAGRKDPTNLSLALLKNITDNFSKEREIGHGGFATVYKGVLPKGNVAVKRLKNGHTIDEALFYREVDSLLMISHPNIVRFLGFCASTDQTAIKIEGARGHVYAEIRERLLCFEYISNGNLQKHITDGLRGLDWSTRYQVIKGICDGLHYLHMEKRIYHMDLKPANILLDNDMVPKITDFGLSRLDEKSQTMSVDRYATLGYCAPEYLRHGKMSFKSDIYSLGIIIIELVTGEKSIPDDNRNNVLRRWMHRWKKTGKGSPLGYQQLTKCIDIGLLCQEIDPCNRLFIPEIVRDINEMEGTNSQISVASESAVRQISPYPEEDMLGIEPLELHFPFELNKEMSCSLELTNETDSDIAFEVQKMTHLPYCIEPHKGIVPPRSKCGVDITLQLQPQDKASQRANEFIVRSRRLNNVFTTEHITTAMFSKSTGNDVDEVNLDVVFDREMEAKKELPSEMQCMDKSQVVDTNDSNELILHSITEDMSNIKTGGTVGNVKKSQECLLPTPLWTSSTGSQNRQEAANESNELQQASDETSEIITRSNTILDVHPLELCFHFEPNKLIACSLDLTNNTDEKLAFGLLKKSDKETFLLSRLPMFGVVDPGTTYTLVLIMDKHKNLPEERNVDLIMRTSANCNSLSDDETFMQHFQNVEQLGITVHQVTLKGVCALQGGTIFESIPPSIKIISSVNNYAVEGNLINCIDVNGTEPLILTGLDSGHVRIWNCDRQRDMDSCKIRERNEVLSVKFIARKGWFVVGSHDGFIRVYNYKNEMKKTTSFKAHGEVWSLAIHPTQSYVLSASTTIKLWDWGQGWFGWKCMQTFKEHSRGVNVVAFNPEDYNSFASASDDGTIKVWSLDSPKSKYTLSGHSRWLSSLDFFSRDGQQYLISGSKDKTAKIWDMKKKECVHTLPHQSAVRSVLPHPKLPLLLTGTKDGTVYLWSSTDFRLKRILTIGDLYWVGCLACLNESGRVVVAHVNGLSVIEISDEEEQGSSSSNKENSISAAD